MSSDSESEQTDDSADLDIVNSNPHLVTTSYRDALERYEFRHGTVNYFDGNESQRTWGAVRHYEQQGKYVVIATDDKGILVVDEDDVTSIWYNYDYDPDQND